MSAVNNHDVAGLHARMNRFIEEVKHSESAGGSHMTSFDQARLGSYLGALDGYREWAIGRPALDCPETHPRAIELGANPEIADLENESCNDVIRLLMIARDELTNSQSARLSSNLVSFDNARLVSIVAKIRVFLTEYIAKVTPLDLPESSPQAEQSGAGKTGI